MTSDKEIKKSTKFLLKRISRKLQKALIPRYQKTLVFEQSLVARPLKEPKIEGLHFKVLKDPEEMETLIEQRESWYRDTVTVWLNDGNLCFATEYKERIISCIWACPRKVYISDTEYTLKGGRDIVPMLDGWTSPKFRGLGVYTFTLDRCFDYLRKELGYKYAWIHISSKNRISLLVHKKFNVDKLVMTITLIKLFGLKYHRKNEFEFNDSKTR